MKFYKSFLLSVFCGFIVNSAQSTDLSQCSLEDLLELQRKSPHKALAHFPHILEKCKEMCGDQKLLKGQLSQLKLTNEGLTEELVQVRLAHVLLEEHLEKMIENLQELTEKGQEQVVQAEKEAHEKEILTKDLLSAQGCIAQFQGDLQSEQKEIQRQKQVSLLQNQTGALYKHDHNAPTKYPGSTSFFRRWWLAPTAFLGLSVVGFIAYDLCVGITSQNTSSVGVDFVCSDGMAVSNKTSIMMDHFLNIGF